MMQTKPIITVNVVFLLPTA